MNSNVEGNDGASMDRDPLFQLITEEIKDSNEADRLRGWTPWILSATLVSLAWLLAQDISGKGLSSDSVHAAFLLGSSSIFGMMSLRAMFASALGDLSRGPFFFVHTLASPLSAFALFLWLGLLAVACFTLGGEFSNLVVWLAGAIFSVLAVSGLLLLLTIIARIPIPAPETKRTTTTMISGLVLVVCTLLVVEIGREISLSTTNLDDLRAGGILAVGAYMLLLLSRSGTSGPTRELLIQLRRELVLGSSSFEDVRDRIRIALQGLWLSDIVREDLRALLQLIADIRALYGDSFRKVEALKSSVLLDVSLTEQPSPSGLEKVALASTLDVLTAHAARAQSISDEYFKRLGNLQARVAIASRLVKKAESDEAQLMTEIALAQAPADADLDKFLREFHELQDIWNRRYPREARKDEPFGIPASEYRPE